MNTETKTIYVSTEFQHPPIDTFQIDDAQVRQLYIALSEDITGFHYKNINLQGDLRVLSTKTDDGEYRCQFGEQSIILEENPPRVHVDEFSESVGIVLREFKDELPPLFMQKCKIRCLVKPTRCGSPLTLLASRVSNVLRKVKPFERPPSFFGVRFRFFPDGEDDEQVQDEMSGQGEGDGSAENCRPAKGFVTVRFETYPKNHNYVWMEADAMYPCLPPITSDSIQVAIDNIQECYQFLAEKCVSFLDQFDTESEG